MKLSVVIPAYRAEATLPQALASLEAAVTRWCAATGAGRDEAEVIVVEDAEGKGPSWARNRGLERATGECVFFCDADDTVKEDFLAKPYRELERTGADLCFFTYAGGPKLRAETFDGNARVRERYLPAFFGYGNDDVRRWNAGGALNARKEPGQVWRCAFRRAFLIRERIRFDESMTYFEDAAFLSSCVAFAERVASLPDELYVYCPRPGGNLGSGWKSARHWDYKFKVLAFRKRLDAATDGPVWRYCEASCALAALEILKEHRADLARYLSDDRVRQALRAFPVSPRHPLAMLAVWYLRLRGKVCRR